MQLHRESHDRTRTAHSPPRPSASTATAAPPQRRTTNLSVRRGVSLSLSLSLRYDAHSHIVRTDGRPCTCVCVELVDALGLGGDGRKTAMQIVYPVAFARSLARSLALCRSFLLVHTSLHQHTLASPSPRTSCQQQQPQQQQQHLAAEWWPIDDF